VYRYAVAFSYENQRCDYAWDCCGEAGGYDAEFAGCWTLSHEVDEDETEANYENGLLRLRILLKNRLRAEKSK
jgi:hypothetical protein